MEFIIGSIIVLGILFCFFFIENYLNIKNEPTILGFTKKQVSKIKDIIKEPNLGGFEIKIHDHSITCNFGVGSKIYIIEKMSRIVSLSEKDKYNFLKAINDTEEKRRQAIIDEGEKTSLYRYCNFPGGWYCEPLKKYATSIGYRIYSDGNSFDLCIRIPEDERKYIDGRKLNKNLK